MIASISSGWFPSECSDGHHNRIGADQTIEGFVCALDDNRDHVRTSAAQALMLCVDWWL